MVLKLNNSHPKACLVTIGSLYPKILFSRYLTKVLKASYKCLTLVLRCLEQWGKSIEDLLPQSICLGHRNIVI